MLSIVLVYLLFVISMGIIYFVYMKAKDYIRVSATGKAEVKPDQAQVDIGLRSTDVAQDQLNAAREQSAATFQKVIADVKQRAPNAKIETQNFNVSENYQYPVVGETEAKPKTFTISNRIAVTLKDVNEIGLLSSIIDSAIANGANDVGQVSYSLTDEAKDKTLQQAQAMSMKNAYDKAKNLAESGGKTLGTIQTIEESGQPEVFPYFARAQSVASDLATKTPTPLIAPETIPVTSNVTVQYSLE